jgi:hypothetical protein
MKLKNPFAMVNWWGIVYIWTQLRKRGFGRCRSARIIFFFTFQTNAAIAFIDSEIMVAVSSQSDAGADHD